MFKHLLAGTALLISAGTATSSLAATKAMECERYQIGSDGYKAELFTYTITGDLDAAILKIDDEAAAREQDREISYSDRIRMEDRMEISGLPARCRLDNRLLR
ncbi:hypothetical protein [Agrobacterium tumefaciens]|uniref:hypothetical protein n=1 Tax=Agrobacterium tumefaciens TaxID=358 RepID=UPI0022035C46|nr:hypothetical protein FY131_27035 [Agrobacterium tumefaciens]